MSATKKFDEDGGKAEAMQSALEESQQLREEMSALLKGFRAILNHQEFKDVAREIFDSCKKLIKATSGYVALTSEDGTENSVLFLSSGGRACTVDPLLPMPIRGMREKVYKTGQVEYDNNFAGSDWVRFLPAGHMPLENVLFAPLMLDGKAVGLLGLANKPGGFTSNDALMAADFAEFTTIALLNSRNLQSLRQARDELEAKVQDRTAQLESANSELEAFSYSVSHDLKSPLQHITGYAELLNKRAYEAIDEKSRQYVRVIADSAIRMGKLIDDLLSFSRMGRAEMLKKKTNLDSLVKEILRDFLADERGRNIDWRISPLPEVYGDSAMLRQVFVNLISNAYKFTKMQTEAVIEIGSRIGEKDEVFVYVKDNGAGFDMKYVDKLFGVFQRLHSTEKYEGTGIGLANVRRIIQRHGGRVWAEGKVGEGATFFFTLSA